MEQLNLTLTLNQNGSITANWSQITGAIRYTAYMYPIGESYAIYNEQNLVTTSYTSRSDLEANKQYKVTVVAYSSSTSIVSDGAKVLISSDFYNNIPLEVPQNIKAVASTISVTVTFDKVERATSYDILFDGAINNVTNTTKQIYGLKPKTSHTYAVRAKNANKTGEYSATKTIMTLPQTPAVPSNIKKTVTENSAIISWGIVSGATSYDVLFNGTIYNATDITKTITGLTSATSYTFQIRAKNADAISAYSTIMTVTTASKPPTSTSAISNENSVTVNWSAVTGATGYILRFSGADYHVNATSYTVTGLLSNTAYTYQVCAKNADGNGSYSTVRTSKTAPKPPEVPTINSTQNSVTLSWSKVTGATSYDVLFDGKTYRVSGTSKAITGLTPGTSYTYSIRSNSADGSSSYIASKTVTTLPNPPGVPTNVSASVTANSATVNWSPVTDATSYDVKFNGETYNTTGTSKTITGLTPNSSYTYWVRANNAGGSSSYSAQKTVKTSINPPVVPANISATATSSSIIVSWSAVTGATGYDVLFNGTVYSVTSTSKIITGLVANTNYNYQVRANNSGGTSAYSALTTVKTLPPIPTVPTNVSATSTTNSITVTWSGVSGATSYDVSLNGTAYRVTSTSKIITGLKSGTNYNYMVRANNAGGSSAYSATKTIQTIPTQPEVPINVSASASPNSVTLSWSAVDGATNYDVLLNDTVYNVTGTSKTIIGLMSNTEYSYQVRAKNTVGNSAYSVAKIVRTILGIPENIHADVTENSVSINWNPVSGATSYDIDFNGMVYNVIGTGTELTGLTPETSYSFVIRAKNTIVSSEYSQPISVSTLVAVPKIPSNVNATSTLNSVIVSWSGVDGATSYDVSFDDKNYNVADTTTMVSNLKSMKSSIPETVKLKEFFGLKPNTEHSYCVRANNESDSSAYSTLKTITTKISKQSGLPNFSSNKIYPDGKIPHMGLDPVNALTGSFLWSYTYLEDFGKDALHFTTMYDSQRDEYPKVLGKKWTYSLNYLLYIDSKYAYFSTPYDEVIPFSIDVENDNFLLAEGIQSGYTMGRKEDQSYFVRNLDGTEYIFDSKLCLNKIIEGGLVTYEFRTDKEGQITNIVGRHGGNLILTYTNGYISRVSDVMGNAVTFVYDGSRLISAVNPDGNGMSFIYDDSENLLEITDFSGKSHITNQYDIQGRVVAQNTAGRGNSFASYDEINRVTTFTDELGNETKYYYDAGQHITSVELEGCGVHSIYNDNGQLIEQTDRLGNSTQMAYDENGRMNYVTHPDGTEEKIFYNDRNYPIKMINRDGTESLYGYDTGNNLISAWDERGNAGSYSYDSEDNLLSYTDKNGHVWIYTYDSNHHLEQAEDPEGNIYKYNHDAIGRLLSYTTPTGSTTTYNYSAAGDLLHITDGDGIIAFDYNENGNQTGVTDRMGNKQRRKYNEMGQIMLATDFMGNEYKFTYDEKGNLVGQTDPLGYSQSYVYDAWGNRTAWTDQNGGVSTYSFNAASQLTEVKVAADSLIKYTYDTMGKIRTVADALNNQTDYSYDAMGRITRVTNALGHSVSYTYDQVGNLLTKTDENGVVMEYTYDKENRLISIHSDLGTVNFAYDKLGRVITVQDVDGHLETSQFDGDGNITAFSGKESHRTTYVYDNSGHLSEETDPNGSKTSYAYDRNGNCIKVTDAKGSEYLYGYDANNRMTKVTDPLGHETSYEYNARGDLKSVIDARGGITAFTYDGNGNLIKEVNPVGGVKTYTYDILNRLMEEKDEDGNKRTFVYDANGNMTSYTDAGQNKWEYEYDAINHLISVTSQDGGRLGLDYTKTGKIAKVTDQEGAETNYRYDSMGRLLEMSDESKNSLSYTYDSQGRVLTQTDANGNMTEYEYSPSGNLLNIKYPEGNTTRYTYNPLGQVLTEMNSLGGITSYEYDALGQVTFITDAAGGKISFLYTVNGKIDTVTDPNGGITQYQYDGCGNLTQTTDPLGNTVAYEYDAMNNQIKECLSISSEQTCATIYQYDKKGQMVREINPMSDEKAYTYDANGNIATILDEDRNETTVRYDLNNRPLNMRYSDGKEAFFRYNKRGELVELKDWNGTATMEYGKAGRLAKATDHNGRSTGYGYDANGNITSIAYPDGSTVNYNFDKNNRILRVVDAEEQITQYEYDLAGNILSICQPGSTSTYAYNAKGLPTKAKYQLNDGTFMENSYAYDAMGNIISSDRNGNTPELTKSGTYSYDALGQLLSCKEGQITESYGYDVLGNRILKKVDGRQKASCQYNALNQLVNRTEDDIQYNYGYDRRGNLTEEKRGDNLIRQYVYDATSHMVMGKDLENGEKTEYGYNALYMRVKNVQTLKNQTGGYKSHAVQPESAGSTASFTTREISYVTDYLSGTDNDLMAYEKGYGAVRATYGRGYERLSQKVMLEPEAPVTARSVIASTNIGKSYFQSDLAGSPLFAASGQGEVLRYAERGVWGDLKVPMSEDMNASGLENSLRFTSYCYDPVIDKHFAHARFYDANQGRMLARDPVKRGLNAYPYCKNNPVNYVDPTGEIFNILAGGFFGGVIGGALGFVESAVSQVINGEQFDVMEAFGSGANGAVVGAARGALITSGVGLVATLATNFAAGAVGSALEQKIARGNVDFRESVTSGLTNAISGAIYGNNPLTSSGNAFFRGAGAGAATAGINNLSNAWKNRNAGLEDSGVMSGITTGGLGTSPYGVSRDPRAGCGAQNPFVDNMGYLSAHGYQYKDSGTKQTKKGGFSLIDFAKDVAIGTVLGGLGSLAFYKATKPVDTIKNSIRNANTAEARGNKGGSEKTYQTYTKTNPTTKEVYSGRTSGTKTPAENITIRDANHHMNEKGFGTAILDKSSSNKAAIRGREQLLIDAYGGAKSMGGTSGNAINGISPSNQKRNYYLEEAYKEFM